MKVILLGYMTSGKSFIGGKIAEILDFEFMDLDHYVENKEGISISKIFSDKGEIYFRKIENQYLNELLLSKKNLVISLGGGTPCYANNMDVISKASNTKSIYLKTSLNVLVERLMEFKDARPLVSHIDNKDEMTEFVGKHLFERSHFYNQSEILVNADGSDKEIIEAILFELF